jgi:hypothetical protein
MKKFLTILVICALVHPAFSSEKQPIDRKALTVELKQLDESLKPLREKAYRESEVIEARKVVDEAFREYYRVLRKKMAELEPAQAPKIKRLLGIRELIHGKHSGSRAEDYEN